MKVKCRIALAVNSSGHWSASGWANAKDRDSMECVLDAFEDDRRCYWIEVEVDAPEKLSELPVIQATATPA